MSSGKVPVQLRCDIGGDVSLAFRCSTADGGPGVGEASYNREWDIPLGSGNEWLRVRINVERGRVNRFVLQYETVIGDTHYRVVRYDCAHGFPHRDILDHRGRLIDKQPLVEQVNLDKALKEAMAEIRNDWWHYRGAFLRRIAEEIQR